MLIFRNAVFIAAIAGLCAGLVLAALQSFATVPLIMEAETYESSAPAHHHGHSTEASDESASGSHHHDEDAWAPADGIERFAYTALVNVVTGIGFALILVAASELAGGIAGWRPGLLWGLAGFAVFILAPGLGMPPELPAMPAGDLVARQSWWMATVLLTAGGLALIFFWRSLPLALLAIAMIVAPHVWGAPLPDSFETPVPADLHHRFVVASTMTNLLFWLVLGMAAGAARSRLNLGAPKTANGFA